MNAEYWIEKLALEKHPEGGYFKETYRSQDVLHLDDIERYKGARNSSTAIYYLLAGEQFSAFHQLKSDEIFHFYAGSTLLVHIINDQGEYSLLKLGQNPEQNEQLQLVIKQGCWFASQVEDVNSYSLIGCTVSPGFDFQDFLLGTKLTLIQLYPQHTTIIEKLTYS